METYKNEEDLFNGVHDTGWYDMHDIIANALMGSVYYTGRFDMHNIIANARRCILWFAM